MSKGVFINDIETYIGWALFDEFAGEKPEENTEYTIYGTYLNKDSSEKPVGVKKMMKRSKPGLFRKYMQEKFDVMIFDLHSNQPEDIQYCITSLSKKPLASEKTVIVISSFLSWGMNENKMVPEKPPEEDGDNKDQDNNNNNDEEKEEDYTEEKKLEDDKILEDLISNDIPDEELDEEMKERRNQQRKIIAKRLRWEEIRKKKIVKLIRAPYEEEEFALRIPCEEWKKQKELEDYLLSLKVENLSVYIICAGIPYGYAETVFNYHFKDAWKQENESLPYFNDGQNFIPTIHVKDLARIVKLVSEKKPEQKYIIVTDQTADKRSRSIVSSIAQGIGTGRTHSLNDERFFNNSETYFDRFEDLFIDPELVLKKKIDLTLTEKEFNWYVFMKFDTWIKPSKIIEEEYEWWSKDFSQSIPKLLNEFCRYRKLRPIRVVLNCKNTEARTNFAIRLSRFYNIPIINYTSIVKTLSIADKDLDEEEANMFKPFMAIKKKLDLEHNEEKRNFLMYDVLKEILRENVCKNRGYVLTGIPINNEEIQLLYWSRTEKPLEEGDEGYEPPDDDGVDDSNMDQPDNDQGQNNNNQNNDNLAGNVDQGDGGNADGNDGGNADSNNVQQGDGDNKNQQLNVQDGDGVVNEPSGKKKKKKPIKTKTVVTYNKDLIPESVITIRKCRINSKIVHDQADEEKISSVKHKKTIKKNFEGYHVFFDVEIFFQEKKIEILDLILEKDKEEMFESIRIYVERAGRPFNYFKDFEDDIHNKRMKFIKDKYIRKENEKKAEGLKNEKLVNESERDYWDKMLKRINQIKADKEEVLAAEQLPTRKFLLLNIMPILTKGLLEVCKINPIDPIDHLADFLFQNSNDL